GGEGMKIASTGHIATRRVGRFGIVWPASIHGRNMMLWNMMSQGRQSLLEWRQKRTLREMLNDPRSAKGCRSIGQLEKGIAADRATTERLLLAIGARQGESMEQWTLAPLGDA
ncbi:MAG: hypothetical protein ACXU87_20575, partial [Xanthobacteraceae bacterium]